MIHHEMIISERMVAIMTLISREVIEMIGGSRKKDLLLSMMWHVILSLVVSVIVNLTLLSHLLVVLL